jgi:hypothetical protein
VMDGGTDAALRADDWPNLPYSPDAPRPSAPSLSSDASAATDA